MRKNIQLKCCDKNRNTLLEMQGEDVLSITWERAYEPGDFLELSVGEETFVELQLDEAVEPAVIYVKKSPFVYWIPTGEELEAYAPEAFRGTVHRMFVRCVDRPLGCRNLSENSLDVRGESNGYPHCTATVETRGESVFAARNTIDGLMETNMHGEWPYTSWGEGEDPNAWIQIEFGREVEIDEVRIYLRSDFPHDNYWQEVTLELENSADIPVKLEKTGDMQRVLLKPHRSSWIRMKNLKKDLNDPSPFPALTQWQVFGREV